MSRVNPKLAARLRVIASIASFTLTSALLASAPASAQTPEELTALRTLFTEGRALESKNAWADALEKFKKVAAVKTTPQVRFHIALCEENLGHLVSAMKGFDLATEDAKQAGAAAVEVATNAPARAEALRTRIPKLRLDPSGKVVTSKITLDDVAVAAKDLGSDMQVDPGAHVVEVRDKDGNSTFRKELKLAEKTSEHVDVTVDDQEAAPPPVEAPSTPPSHAPSFIVGSVGAAALATSAVFWVLRGNTISEIADHCNPPGSMTGCRPSDSGLQDKGKTYGTVAGVMLGVGIAGVVTAGVLWFVPGAKKAPPPAKPSAVRVRVLPTGTGVEVLGTF
jgi:hypothetical protein